MKKLNPTIIVTKFSEIIEKIQSSEKGLQGLIAAALVLGLTAFLSQWDSRPDKVETTTFKQSMDTYIPEDKSLVTIEVANYESLDQIIGQYGVVDLYSVPLAPGERAKLVIRKVKLVRTARSPRHFNVLLAENDAGILAGFPGTFTVSIRNPKLVGTKIVKEKAKARRRRISFESEIL